MQPCPGQSSWRKGDTPRNKFQSDQTSTSWKISPLQLARDEKPSFREISSSRHFKGKLLAGRDIRDIVIATTPFSFILFNCFTTDSKGLLFKNDNLLMPKFRQLIDSWWKEYFPDSWMDSASEIYERWSGPMVLTDTSQPTSTSSGEVCYLGMYCSSLSH